ncbi:MAG: methylaspartate ammonia-lyase [Acholeplasmataceae bacterium]
MKIIDVVLSRSWTGFYFDDQKAIKADAKQDGFFYLGEPQTAGFDQIRIPGEAVSIQLVLENGAIAQGDCAAVQYSGAGGRDPLFLADQYITYLEKHFVPLLIGEDIREFRPLAIKYEEIKIEGKRAHTAIRYGISQALLHAVAIANQKTMAEVIRDEYNAALDRLEVVPIFSQSGDDRYSNIDKMIIKEADSLPHALINNVETKLGKKGELLAEYIKWLSNRIITRRAKDSYNPIIHIDVYGTIGIAFNNNIEKVVDYLISLEEMAKPLQIRIEGPIDAGNREDTMIALRDICKMLEEKGSKLEIVADEWCNTLDDIKYFADNKAGHMLQIKTPDLGSVHNTALAILYCKENKIGAYVGGTCNETNISAVATTNVAIACQADVCLAKPGMGVDEGFMIVKNDMNRVIALSNRRK